MLEYIVRRLVWAIPTLFAISILSFFLMELPPGDYLTSYAGTLAAMGEGLPAEQLEALKAAYGLDQPIYVRYFLWITGVVTRGDFGLSLEFRRPVSTLIWEVLGWTVLLTGITIVVSWLIAIPIGIYSATHQYSRLDHFINGLGFIGLGVPNFTMALVVLWIAYAYFGYDLTGLQADRFRDAPWSLGKFQDLLGHLWLPVLAIAWHDLAPLQRIMRANLLDELSKPYVTAARAGGLSEWKLIWEYPVRVALNPFVSSLGFVLPELISGATIISIVLALPMTGPLLLRALRVQDMYLAGAFILMIGSLTIVGVLLSDVLLAALDPRIRYGRR
jgi:peptide/nickel transport system permease protein